ncbi:MAG: lysophospholipid acyltransferase family protein [Phycisphaerales bacterium]
MFDALRARQPGASLGGVLFYRFCASVAWLALRLLFGARGYQRENVPATGGLIIAANHQSYLDPPAIGGLLLRRRHFDFIARSGLFTFRPFGWLIAHLNSIPVRGDGGDTASIKEVLRRLEMNRAVIIFPEGGRSHDGELHEFKRGAALLVKRSGCPVLPAAIDGAFQCWPPGRKFPLPWKRRVRVLYGEPIPHDELMKDGPDAAMLRLHDEVEKLLAQLRAN